MIQVKNKKDCCGCTACKNICPKDAIDMIEDEEGFLYPVVNKDQCINCGLCEKICPIINKKEKIAISKISKISPSPSSFSPIPEIPAAPPAFRQRKSWRRFPPALPFCSKIHLLFILTQGPSLIQHNFFTVYAKIAAAHSSRQFQIEIFSTQAIGLLQNSWYNGGSPKADPAKPAVFPGTRRAFGIGIALSLVCFRVGTSFPQNGEDLRELCYGRDQSDAAGQPQSAAPI